MMRAQEQMTAFLQGTAAYMQAVGPAIQSGRLPAGPAVEIYAAFARNFQLGKSAEDALDRLVGAGRQSPAKAPEGEDKEQGR